jgi:hypothetical protein
MYVPPNPIQMKRRKFIKYGVSSLLTAPLIYSSCGRVYEDLYASPVVSVRDQLASSLQFRPGRMVDSFGIRVDKVVAWDIQSMRIARMVDTAVMELTGQPSVGKAWESLFPAGFPHADTKIGIKHNFSYSSDMENDWTTRVCPFGPKSAVTNAIVSGLTQMLDGTFPPENITLFERIYSRGTRNRFPVIQGYRPVFPDRAGIYKDSRPGASRIHWISSTGALEIPDDAPAFIAAPDYPRKYRAPQRIFAGVYEHDFLINYIIAKDHREAGITGAMKNNYGCTDNPVGTHGTSWTDKESPYAGTRLCAPVFYKNVNQQAPYILNFLDALAGIYHGGPLSGNIFHTNSIAVSQDPVALDSYQLGLVNRAREASQMHLISTEDGWTPCDHPNAPHIRIASLDHGLGSMSMDHLESIDLSGASDEVDIPSLDHCHSRIGDIRKVNKEYRLPLFLDRSGRTHSIESHIEDMEGNVIRSFPSSTTISHMAELRWDHKDDNNREVKGGFYTWFIRADGILHSGTINDNIS